MKKTILLSSLLFLLNPFFTYAADQIVFEQTDGSQKIINFNDNTTIVTNPKNSDTDSDILFVQEDGPKIPQIDSWSTLVQDRNKNFESIEQRLKNGQNVNQFVFDGNSMLTLAAMQNNLSEAQLALKYKANTHLQNKNGETALHWAAGTSSIKLVEAILYSQKPSDSKNIKNSLTDINKKSKNGRTPLHFAALYKSNPDIIQLLLDNKADLTITDINGQTPAHFAAGVQQWDNLAVLVKNGADLSLKDKNNSSAEDLILYHSNTDTMVRFYPYLSTTGKQYIKDNLGSFYNFDDIKQSVTDKTTGKIIPHIFPPLKTSVPILSSSIIESKTNTTTIKSVIKN